MKGVVLNGPFLQLGKDVQSPVRKFAARVLCKMLPNFQVRKFSQFYIFPLTNSFNYIQVGKISMDHVTGDKEMIEVIAKDPLWWSGGVKLKTGTALLNAVEVSARSLTQLKNKLSCFFFYFTERE